MSALLTVIVTLHREGHLARASLASALKACRAAEEHGVACRLAVVIDRGDTITSAHVSAYRAHLDALHEVDFGDVGLARNLAIRGVSTKYLAMLDGDDLFSPDWLWKGFTLLESLGNDRVVAHAQVRMTFGSQLHGRWQVPSDSPLFHPLFLVCSWPYATDLIATTHLFRERPYIGRDERWGFAAEDWHWNCESLADGIRHVIVPETSYFYRRQPDFRSLGLIPGITFAPTRLFDAKVLANLHGRHHLSPMLHHAGMSRAWDAPVEKLTAPAWLVKHVKQACELDLTVYPLLRELGQTPIMLPCSSPAAAAIYGELVARFDLSVSLIVAFADRFDRRERRLMDSLIRAHALQMTARTDICCISLGTAEPTADRQAAPGDVMPVQASGVRLVSIDLGDWPSFASLDPSLKIDVLARLLIQIRPALTVNLNSLLIDQAFGRFGRSLSRPPGMTVRLCRGRDVPRFDPVTRYSWQNVETAKGLYHILLCEQQRAARWMHTYFSGCGCRALACPADGQTTQDLRLGEAIATLLTTDPCCLNERGPGALTAPMPNGPSVRPSVAIDVSCVVCLHREGHYGNQAIRSILAMRQELLHLGKTMELVVMADSPGPRTELALCALRQEAPEIVIQTVAHHDPGKTRNQGIACCRGRFVAVFNGSDLVSPSWLVRALIDAEQAAETAIFHPEFVVSGPSLGTVTLQPDMRHRWFSPLQLAFDPCWLTPALARGEVYRTVPYRSTPMDSCHGFTAWQWNCETVAAGYEHRTVADCVILQRPGCTDDEFVNQVGVFQSKFTLASTALLSYYPIQPSVGATIQWIRRVRRSLATIRRVQQARAVLLREQTILARWEPAYSLTQLQTPTIGACVLALGLNALDTGIAKFCQQLPQRYPLTAMARAMQAVPRRVATMVRSALGRHQDTARVAAMLENGLALALIRYNRKVERMSDAWERLTKAAAFGPTHVFLVPTCLPGGAQRSMILCMEAILSHASNRILCINTDDLTRRGQISLPAGCQQVLLSDIAATLTSEERTEVLLRYLTNTGARCLHLFYSWLGWQCFTRHAQSLATRLRIHVSIFSIPPASVMVEPGYAALIGPHLASVNGILTDNQRAADTLRALYGLDDDIVHILRHPVQARRRFAPPSPERTIILWAGRLDADKKPELLIDLAVALPHRMFHVYGSHVLGTKTHVDALACRANIRYQGPFAGFDSIADAPYGLYVHTTVWEGMPNTILEAMQAGLLVIAPDVGGISEVVNERTGVLISGEQRVEHYVEAIETVLRDPARFRQRAENGTRFVTEHHTWNGFVTGLRQIPGYLGDDSASPPPAATQPDEG